MANATRPRVTVGLIFALTTFIALLAAAVAAEAAGADPANRAAAFGLFAMWTVFLVGSAGLTVLFRSRPNWSQPTEVTANSRIAAGLMIGLGVVLLLSSVHLTCSSGLQSGWGITTYGIPAGVWAANFAHPKKSS